MAVSSRRFRRFVSARTSSGRGIEIARGVRQRVQPVHTPNQQLERRLVRSEANAVRTPTRRTRAQSVESHAKTGIVQSGVSQKSEPATEHEKRWRYCVQSRRGEWWIHVRVERGARVVRSFAKSEESVGRFR